MDIPQKKISEDESLIALMHPQKTLKCSHCNFAASTIDDMGNHMQSKHNMQLLSPLKEGNMLSAEDKVYDVTSSTKMRL